MGGGDKNLVEEFSYLVPTCLALDGVQEAYGSDKLLQAKVCRV